MNGSAKRRVTNDVVDEDVKKITVLLSQPTKDNFAISFHAKRQGGRLARLLGRIYKSFPRDDAPKM